MSVAQVSSIRRAVKGVRSHVKVPSLNHLWWPLGLLAGSCKLMSIGVLHKICARFYLMQYACLCSGFAIPTPWRWALFVTLRNPKATAIQQAAVWGLMVTSAIAVATSGIFARSPWYLGCSSESVLTKLLFFWLINHFSFTSSTQTAIHCILLFNLLGLPSLVWWLLLIDWSAFFVWIYCIATAGNSDNPGPSGTTQT